MTSLCCGSPSVPAFNTHPRLRGDAPRGRVRGAWLAERPSVRLSAVVVCRRSSHSTPLRLHVGRFSEGKARRGIRRGAGFLPSSRSAASVVVSDLHLAGIERVLRGCVCGDRS